MYWGDRELCIGSRSDWETWNGVVGETGNDVLGDREWCSWETGNGVVGETGNGVVGRQGMV